MGPVCTVYGTTLEHHPDGLVNRRMRWVTTLVVPSTLHLYVPWLNLVSCLRLVSRLGIRLRIYRGARLPLVIRRLLLVPIIGLVPKCRLLPLTGSGMQTVGRFSVVSLDIDLVLVW